MYNAVDGVGKKVLIVGIGDKILGIGMSVVSFRGIVSVKCIDNEAISLLNLSDVSEAKFILLKYDMMSGMYLGCNSDIDEELLENTYVVDEFNLGYGMVPQHFCDVKGYKSKIV